MTTLLITVNILAGLFLIAAVLLQTGKGADMGAAFGGSSSTVFGPSGPTTVLTKITTVTAALFMLTSLLLAVVSGRERSVFDNLKTAEPAPAASPAAPQPMAAVPQATEPPTAAGAAGTQAETAPAAKEAAATAGSATGQSAKPQAPAKEADHSQP